MIELEIYAAGLREGDVVIRLGHGLETYAGVSYKVDTHHDLVYFEIEEPPTVTYADLLRLFDDVGLVPRLVGNLPGELPRGTHTQRLV
jgi:hypothetical protein